MAGLPANTPDLFSLAPTSPGDRSHHHPARRVPAWGQGTRLNRRREPDFPTVSVSSASFQRSTQRSAAACLATADTNISITSIIRIWGCCLSYDEKNQRPWASRYTGLRHPPRSRADRCSGGSPSQLPEHQSTPTAAARHGTDKKRPPS